MSPTSHLVEKQQEKWCRVGQEDAPCLHLYLCPTSTPGSLGDGGSLNPCIFVLCLRLFFWFSCCAAALMVLLSPSPSAHEGVPRAGPSKLEGEMQCTEC